MFRFLVGATEVEKVAYVNDETTPSFKRRVVGALKAGGETAIEEFLDNPYVNVGKAVVRDLRFIKIPAFKRASFDSIAPTANRVQAGILIFCSFLKGWIKPE